MRFFSKIVFICNICFVVSVLMRYLQAFQQKTNHAAGTVVLQPVMASVAVLGLILAVILNSVFAFIILYRKSIRRPAAVPAFVLWFNLIMLPVEIWYQFLS